MGKVDDSAYLKKREHGFTKHHSFNSISSKKIRGIGSPSNKRSPKCIATQINTISNWLNEEAKKEKSKFDNNSSKNHKQELKSTSESLNTIEEDSLNNNSKIKSHDDQLFDVNIPKHSKDENHKRKWKKLAAFGQIGNAVTENKSTNKDKPKIRQDFKKRANGHKSSKRSKQPDTDHKKISSDTKREKLDRLSTTCTKRKTQERDITSRRLQTNKELHMGSVNPIGKFFYTKNSGREIESGNKLSSKENKLRNLCCTPTKQNRREIIHVRRPPRNSESPKCSLLTQVISNNTMGINKKVRCKLNIDYINDHEGDTKRNHSSLVENCNGDKKSSKREKPKREPGNEEKEAPTNLQKLNYHMDKTEHSKNKADKHNKYVDSSSRSRESKKEFESERHGKKPKKRISEKHKGLLKEKENLDKSIKSSKKKRRIKTDKGTGDLYRKQEKLDKFVIKDSKKNMTSKKSFIRTESSESYDFPTFETTNKKSKEHRSSNSFKKYGVALPSIEEILKEQRDLEKYRNQIEAFPDIEQQCFELPFSVKDLNITQEYCKTVLGCKHLSAEEITKAFKRNLSYLSDIFHGKKYSERHERFFNNKNKSYALTTKDLTYSTSMIVFSYEQIEHAIKLLKEEFDPEDKWTQYFFQVLLPEMCLKIFMDTHEMTYKEAVNYLDTRPIVDDEGS